MEIIKASLNNVDAKILEYIANNIVIGKIVVFPSDTSYGLAVNPLVDGTVDKLHSIKKRPQDKILSYIFKDLAQVKMWADVNEKQLLILKRNLPGPFTFGFNKNHSLKLDVERVSVRIPAFFFTQRLSQLTNTPFTATSANINGFENCYSIESFLQQLKLTDTYPDLIVDVGPLPINKPSTVCHLADPLNPIIIRLGEKMPLLDI